MININHQFKNILFALIASVMAQSDWYTGRGTFYGNEHWLWNIHEGSCGYYYLCPEEGTGWDITALPDAHWGYQGSCGRCYEVKCNPSSFTDNYGETLDRTYQCYDSSATVVVSVTDTCPCNYPTNAYSNERWCCGDMDHLDLSVWAFEKLAETRWGVIGLQYREVPCDFQPQKTAPEPSNPFPPSPIPDGTSCPKGNFPLKSNWMQVQQEWRRRAAEAGAGSYANAPTLPESSSSPPQDPPYNNNNNDNQYDQQNKQYDQTNYDSAAQTDAAAAAAAAAAASQSPSKQNQEQNQYNEEPASNDGGAVLYSNFDIGPIEVRDPYPVEKAMFINSFKNGWKPTWFLAELEDSEGEGIGGSRALCATLEPTGFVGLRGSVGQIVGSMSLELWVKGDSDSATTPNIDIDIGGPQGFCDPVNLQSLYSSGDKSGFTKFDIYLGLFDSALGYDQSSAVTAFASTFQGCGPLDASTMNAITLQNNQDYEQTICFDDIKLLG